MAQKKGDDYELCWEALVVMAEDFVVKARNKQLAQHMMRARVAAQFATIGAMVVAAGGLFKPSKVQAE